jgi:hypothetical protein
MAEGPVERPTVKFPAVDVPGMLKRLQASVEEIGTKVDGLVEDKVAMNRRQAQFEDRLVVVETRPVLTSERVRGVVSNADLELQAHQAAKIIEDQERDKKIAETHALAAAAAKTLQEQSDFMGIGKRGITWVGSKEGRAALTQAAIVVGVVYGILKSAGVFK